VDALLADLCDNAGQYLAGLIAAGMLDHAGRPDKLPELMFPGADPDLVRRIWETALPVGYRAGKLAGRPSWTAEGLDRLRTELVASGYTAMARLAARSRSLHPPAPRPHPADQEDQDTQTRRGHR
jgi:hypothetical protein